MEKIDFNDWSKYSEEMATYCLWDTRITAEVFLDFRSGCEILALLKSGAPSNTVLGRLFGSRRRNGFAFDVKRAGILFAEIREQQERTKGEDL
jgi:hypothetical protein